MVIYNYCSKCGRKIKAIRWDPILSLSLETTKRAICSDCDPDSRWIPVYPKIEGEGKIKDWKYKVIETKVGKGLLMEGPGKKSIYLAPLASKMELEYTFYSLPYNIRKAISEFELVKNIKLSMKSDVDKESKVGDWGKFIEDSRRKRLAQEVVEKIRKRN